MHDAVDVVVGREVIVVKGDGSALRFRAAELEAPPRPFPVADVVQLSWQSGSVCAVRKNGKVGCNKWPADADPPAQLNDVAGVQDAVFVETGGEHGCALTSAGRVTCFGESPYVVAQLQNVVGLQVIPKRACTLTATREVHCFDPNPHVDDFARRGEGDAFGLGVATLCIASNASALCGDLYPRPASRDTPIKLPSGAEGRKLRQLVVGRLNAACMLDEQGTVRCQGANSDGLLGVPTPRFVERLTAVPGVPALRALTTGRMSCGLSVDGDVYCWGFRTPKVKKLPELSGMERLVGNGHYACAFSATGDASCFDENYKPVRVPSLDGLGEIVFSDTYVAAIGKAGELVVGLGYAPGVLNFSVSKEVGPVRRIAIGPMGILFAQDANGRMWRSNQDMGERGARLQRRPDLDGAISLGLRGHVLLEGGSVVEDDTIHNSGTHKVLQSSPLVSLIGDGVCGLTNTGAYGCADGKGFRLLFDRFKQVASDGRYHCTIDDAGVARCMGENWDWKCGPGEGIKESAETLEIHMP